MYVYLNKKKGFFFPKYYFLIVRTADQEVVLEIFLTTNYNIDQALDKLRLPTTNKNYCIYLNNRQRRKFHFFFCNILVSSATWTLAECDQFEQYFKEYGKDFSMFKVYLFFFIESKYLVLLI